MMKQLFPIFFLLCALFSCQKQEERGSQEVGISFSYTPFTADPRKGTDPATVQLSFMLYEGLTRVEADGKVTPALAKEIKISKDKKSYIFTLKEAMWSDGSPLTAYHFEQAWKRVLDPSFPSRSAHLLYPLKNGARAKKGECSTDEVGVKAIDEETLLVELEHPVPYFLQLVSFASYFPVPYHGDEVPHPDNGGELLTNGPFMLSGWKNDDEITLIRNPYYWNANRVKLDRVRVLIIGDEETVLRLFEQGDVDFFGGLASPLPLDAVPSLKKNGLFSEQPSTGTAFSTFNVNRYPFNNAHIRKAFAYAIHRKTIIENISQMGDDIASGPVPHTLKDVATTFFEDYKKVLAKEHLKQGLEELGITKKEFPKVTYYYFSSKIQKNLAAALQSYWKKVLGIEVKLQAHDLKSHMAKLKSKDFQIAQMSWVGQYYDPMSFLERFKTKDSFRNYSGWENSHYTEMITNSYDKEGAERLELLQEAEALLMEEMPLIPLYHYHMTYVKNPRLKNLAITPTGIVLFHHSYLGY
ncbi:peptide ABC transporter substrate-binding protein [Candidatus Neptunochlamydia vexilliferae]|uniref:Oligopeptide-binding protein OppA n=1 Tax=Candidatus Neptunichlamydia vexilliferae TaxID=1651774 RepID=A0ABS0B2Y0_9BACT|nr:peptide ABC transporter substrate-binding protein [Candidatus Neptunochlamydia vexilliferae]MBF5060232.1 Oligopeptide-binding protein OppA [Candidatus Neptunochlamydia vexilliferae]